MLVVGGGPAGTAAAVAAARLGADVVLLERYNHLGGLSTGGLVIWIDRMTDWEGRHVIRGFAEEVLSRLTRDKIFGPEKGDWGSRDRSKVAYWSLRSAAYHDTVTYSPTLDPEWLKAESLAMVLDAGVHPLFHAWGARPVMEDNRVVGCIFESKEGSRAVLAKVTIDATGDGDIFARAGADFETEVDIRDIHGCMNTAWLFGGIDMDAFIRFCAETPDQFGDFMSRGRDKLRFFEKPVVSWRRDVAVFMGPRLAGYSALKVEDLSEVEIRSHQLMLEHLAFYRENAPGFGDAFIMLSAPQLGVRHGRRLQALGRLTREMWDGSVAVDEIGVSPSLAPKFANVSVPYGAIVPRDLRGLLAPGRHLACDASSHSFMREIPQCWLTGHAAGVAAALAVDQRIEVADVPIRVLRAKLTAQGAYLTPQVEVAVQ
ncbi:FAD-dependent oxidoreductase [Pseudochelatococcus sp. B33]